MNVKEIVIAHLKSIGADGLAGCECGCGIDDLMPCEYSVEKCAPAKYHRCATCNERGECDIEDYAARSKAGGCWKVPEQPEAPKPRMLVCCKKHKDCVHASPHIHQPAWCNEIHGCVPVESKEEGK